MTLTTKRFLSKMSKETLEAIWLALYTDLTNCPTLKLQINQYMSYIDKLLNE